MTSQLKTTTDSSPTGEFAESLLDRIENSSEPVRLKITPEMALVMLRWNDRNRPLKRYTIKNYASDMKRKKWKFTGSAIKFSKNRMLDGQHRLLACIQARKPFETMVMFGVPDDSFDCIDIGSRNTGDILAINGVENAANVGAALRWIIGYEQEQMDERGRARHVRNATILEEYAKRPELKDSTSVCYKFQSHKGVAAASLMMAIHYVCAKADRELADKFFDKLATGIGITEINDPVYRLRQKLITDRAQRFDKMSKRDISALVIKAWNAVRQGREIKNLHLRPTEAFPKVL